MTTQEKINLASVLVATISLTLNLIMGIALHRLNRRRGALGDLITALRPLLNELERTTLFEISPDAEIWEFGFGTLSNLAGLCASAHVAAKFSKFADEGLRVAISCLHDHVKGLRAFQDSWRIFRAGKENQDWRMLQQEWPDIQSATAALRAARPAEEQCKRSLSQFFRKHGIGLTAA